MVLGAFDICRMLLQGERRASDDRAEALKEHAVLVERQGREVEPGNLGAHGSVKGVLRIEGDVRGGLEVVDSLEQHHDVWTKIDVTQGERDQVLEARPSRESGIPDFDGRLAVTQSVF